MEAIPQLKYLAKVDFAQVQACATKALAQLGEGGRVKGEGKGCQGVRCEGEGCEGGGFETVVQVERVIEFTIDLVGRISIEGSERCEC